MAASRSLVERMGKEHLQSFHAKRGREAIEVVKSLVGHAKKRETKGRVITLYVLEGKPEAPEERSIREGVSGLTPAV